MNKVAPENTQAFQNTDLSLLTMGEVAGEQKHGEPVVTTFAGRSPRIGLYRTWRKENGTL